MAKALRTVLRAGPFQGVTDTYDPSGAKAVRLLGARNCFASDPAQGAAYIQRRGFLGHATALAGQGQAVYLHQRLDGTVTRYVFAGAKMYRWDGATTYTDVTPSGITLDSTAPVFVTAFYDELVVTDGVNQPWVFTPGDGTADLIQCFQDSRAWTAQGPAVVYGGKVFFILKTHGTGGSLTGAQNAIVWCEEADVRTGYQQSTYDQVWELTQTSAEALTCLVAEEGALVYFRANGIGFITGSVSDDFRASATRDAISTTIGTNCPAAVSTINRTIYFPDLDGQMHTLTVGGGPPVPIWAPMRRTVTAKRRTVARSTLVTHARAGYYEAEGLLLVTLWDATTVYVFRAETGDYQGTWALNAVDDAAGEAVHALGTMTDSTGLDTFLILGTRSAGATTGIVWRQKTDSDAGPWLDTPTSGVDTHTTFARWADTSYLASDPVRHFVAEDVKAQIVEPTPSMAFTLTYTASGATAASSPLTATVSSSAQVVGVATVTWGLGANAQGTGLRFRIAAVGTPTTPWGLQSVAVTGAVHPQGGDSF